MYTLKQISFKNLTPLFGFSDIRSSSEKRYNLMLADLNQQIENLHDIFPLSIRIRKNIYWLWIFLKMN
jgi:hypothetical protein